MDRPDNGLPTAGLYAFEAFRLEARERRLWRGTEPITLQPKVFDTLVLLVANAGHLMTKEDLMTALWPDAVVEESNLTKNIWSIRKALGDAEGGGTYVETVPRVGYRFVAPVRTPDPEKGAPTTPDPHPSAPRAAQELPLAASLERHEAPSDGTRLGPYEILATIGSGGMGQVYRARDTRLDRDVAIKVLPESIARDPERMRRFQTEAQSAGSLNHPAITAVYDFGSHAGSPYIVTELLEGETLRARMASGPLPARRAVDFAIQVVEGLAAAHEKGVVHRDLKPENLFVTRDGRVKILDFGLAKRRADRSDGGSDSAADTEPGAVLGTSDYMSPEQVRGLPADQRSDIFSLGAVLYEMLSGRRAFHRGTAAETMAAVLNDEPAELAPPGIEISQDLHRLVRHCLEKNPADRFQSARDLAFALASVSASDAAPAPAERTSAALIAPARWRPARMILAAAVAAAAVAAALLIARARKPRSAPPPNPAVHARRSVAVLGLRNLSGRPDADWLGTALSSMVTAELAAGEKLRVVPAENVARRRLTPPAGALSTETLSVLRSDLSADEVVIGSYVAILAPGGEQLRLDVFVQDAATGETLAAVSETGTESDLFRLVSEAGQQLRIKLGLDGPTAAEAASVKASLPTKPEATRLYAEGLGKLRRGEASAARDLLIRAAEAQPDFPLAHAALSDAWSALGYDQRAEDEARLAFDRSEGLSREDRLLIEARLAQARKRWDEAERLYQSLWTSFPDDSEYGLRVAQTQIAGGHLKNAMRTIGSLRRLPAPQGEDPRIDLAEADAAAAVADSPREKAAAVRAVEKAERLGADMILAQARMREGDAAYALGDYPGAKPKYEQARTLYERSGDRSGAADALRNLGSLCMAAGDLPGARTLYEKASEIFREIGDRRGEAAVLTETINLDWLQAGNLRLVGRELEQLRALDEEAGNRAGIAWALNGSGVLAWDQGDLSHSMDLHRQALAISREIGKSDWEAWTLECIGNVFHSKGDLQSARRNYEDAIAIKKRLGNESGVARTLDDLSDVLYDMGSLAEAATTAEEALAIEARLGEKESQAETDLTLAQVRIATGRAEDAVRLASAASAQFAKDRARGNEALAQGSLVQALLALGRIPEAEEAARRARSLLTGVQQNEALVAQIACARADAASGRVKPARKELEEILQKANRIGWINFQFDARLTLAQVDLEAGEKARGKAELEQLARDARGKGFGCFVNEAHRLLNGPTPQAARRLP